MNRIISRLNKIAYDLTEEEKFINECEDSGKFDEKQIAEIRNGLENGLTIEQVKVYADPKFDWQQMEEIREGSENGLTIDQIKLYANPKYNWREMYHIKKCFEDGMTIEEVKEKFEL